MSKHDQKVNRDHWLRIPSQEYLLRSTQIFSAVRMRSIFMANNNYLERLHLDLKGIIDKDNVCHGSSLQTDT